MNRASFREILRQQMAEQPSQTPRADSDTHSNRQFSAPAWTFTWNTPNPQKRPATHSAYKTTKPEASAMKPAPAPSASPAPNRPQEPLVALHDLPAAARLSAQVFARLGGPEFAQGLNASTVKKAYRQLVKRLHPDTLGPATTQAQRQTCQAQFQLLTEAYDELLTALSEVKLPAARPRGITVAE